MTSQALLRVARVNFAALPSRAPDDFDAGGVPSQFIQFNQ
jgi:hypothetical protein